MKVQARKDLALALALAGMTAAFTAYLASGIASGWLTGGLLGGAFVLVVLAALVQPPFWWGKRTLTTPLKDPSHEARLPDCAHPDQAESFMRQVDASTVKARRRSPSP